MGHRFAAAAGDDATRHREVCEVWGTDFRTHLTPDRWDELVDRVGRTVREWEVAADFGADRVVAGEPDPVEVEGISVLLADDGIGMEIETRSLRLALSRRRGITVQRLGFAGHEFEPVIGTTPHGYFHSIALGADFYSGGVVIELPERRSRITDLEWVDPTFDRVGSTLSVHAVIDTALGPIGKTVRIPADEEWIELEYRFPGWERPQGTIRAGTITLLPEAFTGPMSFACANGGPTAERFLLESPVDHAAATSALVSSTAGLGATDGRISAGDGERSIVMSWDPAACAVFPMVRHEPATPGPLTRFFFSLLEFDDTLRPGGPVGSFTLRVASSP
jgi:hypothetical protein